MRINVVIIISLIGIIILSSFGSTVNFYDKKIDSDEYNIKNICFNQDNSQPKGTRALADSPWPMFRGNPRHTGLSSYDTKGNQGKLVWKFEVGYIGWSSPVISAYGTIYIGSSHYEEYFIAMNSNGTEKWKFEIDPTFRTSPAIGTDGTIYVSSSDHFLYAINPNGRLKWRFLTGSYVTSSPTIGADGTIYVGSDDKYLYAINPYGIQKWNFTTYGRIESSPAIDTNDTIYVGSNDHYLYAINSIGILKWKIRLMDEIVSSPAIGNDGTIYVGTGDTYSSNEPHYLYAITPNGTEKWKFRTDGCIISSPAIGPDGIIYVGSRDNYLYAVNPYGGEKWKFKANEGIYSSPAIGANGTIYIGSWDHYLYAINPDGTLKWKFKTGDSVHSSPAIGSDGIIYIGSQDHYLYAIGKFPPAPPKNLQIESGNTFVNLNWEMPDKDGGAEITKFNISRGTDLGDEIYLTTVDVSIRSYNDTSVTNGQTYYYFVTAVNEFGDSDPSNRINATPRTHPSPPQNLDAKAGDSYVNLLWSQPYDNGGGQIINYKIYRGEDPGDETYLSSVNVTILSYNDTSVINGQTYNYYITAVNIVGESLPSDKISIIPQTISSSPQNIRAVPGNNFIDLSWEVPSDDGGAKIKEYNIYKATSPNNEIYINSVNGSITSYRDMLVKNGITYYYYITARNSVGESSPSDEVSEIPRSKPSPPRNLSISLGDDHIILTWETPTDNGGFPITEYKIYRGINYREEQFLTSVDANKTYYQDMDVKNEIRYYYYLTAVNRVNESKPSNDADIKIEETKTNNFMFKTEFVISIIIIMVIILIVLFVIKTRKSRQKDIIIVTDQPAKVVPLSKLKYMTPPEQQVQPSKSQQYQQNPRQFTQQYSQRYLQRRSQPYPQPQSHSSQQYLARPPEHLNQRKPS